MKALFITTLFTFSLCSFALEGRQNVEKINLTSMSDSLARKYEGELELKKHQLKKANEKIVTMTNDYTELFAKYRQLQSEKQYLILQNDELAAALKNNGSLTPELAEKAQTSKTRLPASVDSNSDLKDK